MKPLPTRKWSTRWARLLRMGCTRAQGIGVAVAATRRHGAHRRRHEGASSRRRDCRIGSAARRTDHRRARGQVHSARDEFQRMSA